MNVYNPPQWSQAPQKKALIYLWQGPRDKKEGTIWIANFSGSYLYVNETVDQMYVKTGDIIEFRIRNGNGIN